jgi:hypothetical protein
VGVKINYIKIYKECRKMSDYWDEICEHREALIFLGGIATAYIGKKSLNHSK